MNEFLLEFVMVALLLLAALPLFVKTKWLPATVYGVVLVEVGGINFIVQKLGPFVLGLTFYFSAVFAVFFVAVSVKLVFTIFTSADGRTRSQRASHAETEKLRRPQESEAERSARLRPFVVRLRGVGLPLETAVMQLESKGLSNSEAMRLAKQVYDSANAA